VGLDPMPLDELLEQGPIETARASIWADKLLYDASGLLSAPFITVDDPPPATPIATG
jgi:hypothetical protein